MTMNVAEAVISTIILIALMIIAAKLWGWVKKKHKNYSSLFVKVLTIVLLTVFFVF